MRNPLTSPVPHPRVVGQVVLWACAAAVASGPAAAFCRAVGSDSVVLFQGLLVTGTLLVAPVVFAAAHAVVGEGRER